MFNVSTANLKTFIDTSNSVLEDRVQYSLSPLLPPENKTSYEAFGIHQSDSCLCIMKDMAVKLTHVGFGDSYWLTVVGSS
jgi:hypothetical protein